MPSQHTPLAAALLALFATPWAPLCGASDAPASERDGRRPTRWRRQRYARFLKSTSRAPARLTHPASRRSAPAHPLKRATSRRSSPSYRAPFSTRRVQRRCRMHCATCPASRSAAPKAARSATTSTCAASAPAPKSSSTDRAIAASTIATRSSSTRWKCSKGPRRCCSGADRPGVSSISRASSRLQHRATRHRYRLEPATTIG